MATFGSEHATRAAQMNSRAASIQSQITAGAVVPDYVLWKQLDELESHIIFLKGQLNPTIR